MLILITADQWRSNLARMEWARGIPKGPSSIPLKGSSAVQTSNSHILAISALGRPNSPQVVIYGKQKSKISGNFRQNQFYSINRMVKIIINPAMGSTLQRF